MARAEAMALQKSGVFLRRQFENSADVRAHEVSTGPEVWSQLRQRGLVADAFVAGVVTGGTVMGWGAI